MNELVLFIAAAVFVLIAIFITRAVFSIPAILRYFKAIIKLLAVTAVKQGVSEERVREILKEADKK